MHAEGAPTVVLFHGLTATPHQFDLLAPLVHSRRCNVIVPRLPRHGYRDRMTDALAQLRAAELIACVKLALADARSLGGPVTVAGFSLGGLLAAYAAQCETVDRVACISPFFGVAWLTRGLNSLADSVLQFVPNVFLWWDPIKRAEHGSGDGYPRYPLSAVREAFVLRDAVFEDACVRPPATKSIAVAFNPRDTTCHNGLARDLARRWRAAGASVEERTLSDVGAPHDFMTPGASSGREHAQARLYPEIVDVIVDTRRT